MAGGVPGEVTAVPLSPRQGGKSAAQDEVDEIEVYGSEAQSGTQLATYSFEVALAPPWSLPGTLVSPPGVTSWCHLSVLPGL